MNDDELNALTEKIIGCAFRVSNTLGSGFLEKVYENAPCSSVAISLTSKQTGHWPRMNADVRNQ
ncbi:MAG: GxxExxY protein [Pirellulaceae bacterium]